MNLATEPVAKKGEQTAELSSEEEERDEEEEEEGEEEEGGEGGQKKVGCLSTGCSVSVAVARFCVCSMPFFSLACSCAASGDVVCIDVSWWSMTCVDYSYSMVYVAM